MSATLFLLEKIVAALVMPPTGPLLLAMAGLLVMRRSPRLGKVCAWTGIVSVLVLSLPVTATLLGRAVSIERASLRTKVDGAQAIVILGGGRRFAPEYGGETISEGTLERVTYGATLARRLGLPVLVTGGAPGSQVVPEAQLMAETLERTFSINAQWKEVRSRDTHENALFSAEMLRGAGVRRVLLVTHDVHQRRAVAEFEAAGIETIPAPITTTELPGGELLSAYLPNAAALRRSTSTVHEILGNVVAPKGNGKLRMEN